MMIAGYDRTFGARNAFLACLTCVNEVAHELHLIPIDNGQKRSLPSGDGDSPEVRPSKRTRIVHKSPALSPAASPIEGEQYGSSNATRDQPSTRLDHTSPKTPIVPSPSRMLAVEAPHVASPISQSALVRESSQSSVARIPPPGAPSGSGNIPKRSLDPAPPGTGQRRAYTAENAVAGPSNSGQERPMSGRSNAMPSKSSVERTLDWDKEKKARDKLKKNKGRKLVRVTHAGL